MTLKRILIFILTCILIFFCGGIPIVLIQDYFNGNLPYCDYSIIFSKLNLYLYGTILLFGFFTNFIANRVNFLRYFFPVIISGASIRKSGYDFFSIYKKAKKQIIICAQNHHHLANVEFSKFCDCVNKRIKKNVEIHIIMNDVEFFESAITWEAVCFPRSFKKNEYRAFSIDNLLRNNYYHQLIKATKSFHSIHEKNIENIKLSIMPHVPTSITFIDPKEKNGFLVIIPNFYKAKNTERPYFVVKKKYNREIFEQYYKSYVEITDDSKYSLSKINTIKELVEHKQSTKINKTTFIFKDEGKTELKDIKYIT